MGTNPNWPDRNGTAGGKAPDGHAFTRAGGWDNSDVKVFGSTPAGAVTTNSRGGKWTPLPKSSSGPAKFTTGMQRTKR
jgi:hypothetical protein